MPRLRLPKDLQELADREKKLKEGQRALMSIASQLHGRKQSQTTDRPYELVVKSALHEESPRR